jgi:hypothetical protein
VTAGLTHRLAAAATEKFFLKKIFVAKKLFFSTQQPPGRFAAPKNTCPGQ